MNNRSRNKDKAIKRYCTKIVMGNSTLYISYNPAQERIRFNDGINIWSMTPTELRFEGQAYERSES